MRQARALSGVGFVALAVAFHVSCGGSNPANPSQAAGGPTAGGVTILSRQTSGASAQNAAPNLFLKTRPAADNSTLPYPTISGLAPLTVNFNLCNSDDSDQGDSINWQFNFGDSGKAAFNPDGTFNPDFDHFCRVEHVYGEGTYIATLSVTDKHLEDQSRGAVALARTTRRLTIVAGRLPEPTPSAPAGTTHALFAAGPGYACPTGATTFTYTPPLDPGSSVQAKAACEACYGAGRCYLEGADCAGPGWGPRPAGSYVCGEAYFGYQTGCSGDNGRAWYICSSYTTYGYWGKF